MPFEPVIPDETAIAACKRVGPPPSPTKPSKSKSPASHVVPLARAFAYRIDEWSTWVDPRSHNSMRWRQPERCG